MIDWKGTLNPSTPRNDNIEYKRSYDEINLNECLTLKEKDHLGGKASLHEPEVLNKFSNHHIEAENFCEENLCEIPFPYNTTYTDIEGNQEVYDRSSNEYGIFTICSEDFEIRGASRNSKEIIEENSKFYSPSKIIATENDSYSRFLFHHTENDNHDAEMSDESDELKLISEINTEIDCLYSKCLQNANNSDDVGNQVIELNFHFKELCVNHTFI